MERSAQAVSAMLHSEEPLPRPAAMSAEEEKLAARIERAVRRGNGRQGPRAARGDSLGRRSPDGPLRIVLLQTACPNGSACAYRQAAVA